MLEALLQRYPKYGLTFTHSNKTSPLFQINYCASPPTDMQWGPRHKVLSLLLKALPAPERYINRLKQDALMVAIEAHDEKAVWLLLEAGFRVGQRDINGWQALDHALSSIDSTLKQQDKADSADSVSAGRILRLLGRSLRQQPNAVTLTSDSWQRLRGGPIAKDLAVFMIYATSDSTANIAAMMDYEQRWMPALQSLILDGLTNTHQLVSLIANMHMPSALGT